MLRRQVLRGGIALSLRTLLGFAISFGGSVVLARLLALSAFGQYATLAFWLSVLGSLADLGFSVYLVRLPTEPSEIELRTAFVLTGFSSLAAAVLLAALIGPVSAFWFDEPGMLGTFLLGGAVLVAGVYSKIPFVLLERALDYRLMGAIEILALLAHYGTAIGLAFADAGPLALVGGDLARAAATSVLCYVLKRVEVKGRWDRETAKKMWRYGAALSASSWAWTINSALGPIVVAKMAGLEAAGLVRQAYNVLNQSGFLRAVVWRISFPVLGKVQSDPARLRSVVEEGMLYQVPFVAVPMFALAAVGYWLIPLVFGDKWLPSSEIALYAALPLAVNGLFGLHFSALYVVGAIGSVTRFFVVYALSLWPVALMTIHWLGAIGLPIAETICLPTYVVAQAHFSRRFGSVSLLRPLVLLAILYAVAVVAFRLDAVGWSMLVFAAASAAAVLGDPRARRALWGIVRALRDRPGAPEKSSS